MVFWIVAWVLAISLMLLLFLTPPGHANDY
jgi:hypothetical protein